MILSCLSILFVIIVNVNRNKKSLVPKTTTMHCERRDDISQDPPYYMYAQGDSNSDACEGDSGGNQSSIHNTHIWSGGSF